MSFSIEEIANFPYPGMSLPNSFQFSHDNLFLGYLKSSNSDSKMSLYVIDLQNFQEIKILDDLSSSKIESFDEQMRRQRLRQLSTGITRFSWMKGGQILLPHGEEIYILDGFDSQPRLLIEDPEIKAVSPQSSPDGTKIAFVNNGDIWQVNLDGSDLKQITFGDSYKTRGVADYIAQEEMGRANGFWWSLDSKFVAFSEVDNSQIPAFKISHLADNNHQDEIHYYPFVGSENPIVRIGIVNTDSLECNWIDTSGYEYIPRLNWVKSNQILVQLQNREQTKLDVNLYNNSGKLLGTIIKEQSDFWINIHEAFQNLPYGKYVWTSEKTGFRHLYGLDLISRELNQITTGNWQIDSFEGFSKDTNELFFTATKDSELEKHLYRINKEGVIDPISLNRPGIHNVKINCDQNIYIDVNHALSQQPRVELRNLKTDELIKDISPDKDVRIEQFGLTPPKLLKIPHEKSAYLNSAVFYPDENEYGPGPYPTVVYVYGGPHVQLVTDSWGLTANLRLQYLRDQGFLVTVVDNHGSNRRGVSFESSIKNKLGEIEVNDQKLMLDWLIDQGLTDENRVGVFGWSYGGYMTLMCMAKYPELFRVGAAGAPVVNWQLYDTHYTERYLGLLEDNYENYDLSNVTTYAKNLDGELMIIHGMIDENVHFTHSAELIQSLIENDKSYDLLAFPKERHMPRGHSDRVYMEKRMMDFLISKI